MKHELKKHALLLAQALIRPDEVRSRYAATSPDECEMPPENAEVQASLAVSDLLDQALVGFDVRFEAPATLAAAAQFAADKHAEDAAEMSGFWSGEKPSEDHKQSDINRNTEYFDAHAQAAERFSAAIAEALKRYAADIKHAEDIQ